MKKSSSLFPLCIASLFYLLATCQAESTSNPSAQDSKSETMEAKLNTFGSPRPQPLTEALETFNGKAKTDKAGKSQPPLTVEELVAAIRYKDLDPALNSEVSKAYQEILDNRVLPKGSNIEFQSGCVMCGPGGKFDVSAWMIFLYVGLDKHELSPVGNYFPPLEIRKVFISSYPAKKAKK